MKKDFKTITLWFLNITLFPLMKFEWFLWLKSSIKLYLCYWSRKRHLVSNYIWCATCNLMTDFIHTLRVWIAILSSLNMNYSRLVKLARRKTTIKGLQFCRTENLWIIIESCCYLKFLIIGLNRVTIFKLVKPVS